MEKRFTSGKLQVAFSLSAEGAALSAVYDGEKPLFSGKGELFRLTLLHLETKEKTFLSSFSGWTEVLADEFGITLGKPFLRVRISFAPEGENGLALTVSFENSMADFAVYSFEYPRLWFAAAKDLDVFYPARSGLLIGGWDADGKVRRDGGYPASAAIMQYMALCYSENVGLYYGIHDIAGAQKTMVCEKDEGQSDGCLYAEYICRDACSPRNSQTLNGRLVWRLFDGNWYDATMIYRDFALREARWIPEADENGRKIAPAWLRNTAHWWLFSIDEDESSADTMLRAEADLAPDTPSGAHMYIWHRIPFDNDYPHYFPEKPVTPKVIAKLHAAGLPVMPYINGRLWDTRDRGGEDFLFTDEALPGATKNEKGEVFTETYHSKEEDGSMVKLAVMCPSSAVWSDKVNSLLAELFHRLNVDAVYADQIASAAPMPCCDPTHHHPAGGGGWWPEAYDRMLERTARTLPPDKVITTESTAEPFMRHIAAFLSWDCVEVRQVPAFAAVYAGYAFSLGRAYSRASDDVVYALTAEGLLFGEQVGWIAPSRYLALGNREFYRALVRARAENQEFFTAGRLLCPPEVSSDVPDIQGETMHTTEYQTPAVTAGLWRRNRDGKTLLLVCNCSSSPANAKLSSPHFANGEKRLVLPPQSVMTEVL